ncbi:Y4yA family PLP-dependent enzyme [Nocardia sp. NPDC004722]
MFSARRRTGSTLTDILNPLTVSPGISDITATPLPAHRDDWERRLLDHPNLLRTIADGIGGPFHLMYPARITRNIEAFQQVFKRAQVAGAIYYGKKANKSPCVVDSCATTGVGVDVSSPDELAAALRGGVLGTDLVVTGPAKSDRLLQLSARHRALIAIDDPAELIRLTALDLPARVLLRVLPEGSTSRFGLTAGELDRALVEIDTKEIRLEGFSFHLTGYDAAPRAELAAALIDRCLEARTLGHPVSTISIGGGFGVDYVPRAAWESFRDGVSSRWFHRGRALDPKRFYPYHCPVPGPAMLEAVLKHDNLGSRLREAGLMMAIEPGRALLDHAGCTVFTVQGVKTRKTDGIDYDILTVNGTSFSLSEQWFESEFLPDPVLWPEDSGAITPTCVGGSSCLEEDMLSWRRIPLPRAAITGDLLVYPNTSGYMMDSNESDFHGMTLPPKVLLTECSGSSGYAGFRWSIEGR